VIILTEKATFERIIEGFRMSIDGCKSMALHQPEKAYMWNKMAETYQVCQQSCWQLMDEAAAKYKGTPIQ